MVTSIPERTLNVIEDKLFTSINKKIRVRYSPNGYMLPKPTISNLESEVSLILSGYDQPDDSWNSQLDSIRDATNTYLPTMQEAIENKEYYFRKQLNSALTKSLGYPTAAYLLVGSAVGVTLGYNFGEVIGGLSGFGAGVVSMFPVSYIGYKTSFADSPQVIQASEKYELMRQEFHKKIINAVNQ